MSPEYTRYSNSRLSHLTWVALLCASLSHAGDSTTGQKPSAPASAAPDSAAQVEPLVVAIRLNEEAKGEFLVVPETGDYLMRREDLVAIGLEEPKGQSITINGEVYFRLNSVTGVRYAFDEKTVTLALTVAAAQLGAKEIDLATQRHKDVIIPDVKSGFFNYRLAYTDDAASHGFLLNSEFGWRWRDYLFFNDSFHRLSGDERGSVRLTTNLTRDSRERMSQLVIGDFFAASGDLGGALNLGGVSYRKTWELDPYFVRQPRYAFAGALTNAAAAQISLDGLPYRLQDLPAGEFEFRNLQYYGGAREVSVVLKDKFGRTQEFINPFYFTDDLLRAGLHDYGYHLGALREGFGESSNRYGKAAFLGFHRSAPRDTLNLGVRWELSKTLFNVGPQATFSLGNYGVASAALALGRYDDVDGVQSHAAVSYSYQKRALNINLLARVFSDEFRFFGQLPSVLQPHSELFAGVGWGSARSGNFTLSLGHTDAQMEADRTIASFGYSRGFGHGLSAFVTLSHVEQARSGTEVFAGFSYNPNADYNATAIYQRRLNSGSSSQLVAGKNVPFGEGMGYRVALERSERGGAATTTVDPFVQYNARRAIFTAEYRQEHREGSDSERRYEIAAAGGIGFVDGDWALSRPINEAFGVVRLDGIADVRILQNSQDVGRTSQRGSLFLPSLGAYIDNQITVNDKDVPINYSLAKLTHYVSPALRGGAVIKFDARRVQAITGTLAIATPAGKKALEHTETELADGQTLPTAKGGEFYLENLAPGRYRGSAIFAGAPCRFELVVPANDEVVLDLGEVLCAP